MHPSVSLKMAQNCHAKIVKTVQTGEEEVQGELSAREVLSGHQEALHAVQVT